MYFRTALIRALPTLWQKPGQFDRKFINGRCNDTILTQSRPSIASRAGVDTTAFQIIVINSHALRAKISHHREVRGEWSSQPASFHEPRILSSQRRHWP